MVLGNPEQPGRVRGMGKHVTQSQYFHTLPPLRKAQFNLRKWQAEQEEKIEKMLKEQRDKFQAEIDELCAGQQSGVGGSNTTPRSTTEVPQREIQREQIHVDKRRYSFILKNSYFNIYIIHFYSFI